jgi:glucosamine--fructose-6-phosphate aminotransferase (isomerizing)
MCGIFGIISNKQVSEKKFLKLALLSRQRGRDSSGFLTYGNSYNIKKYNRDIKDTVKKIINTSNKIVIGHSRLITNSTFDNQPVNRDGTVVVHNGIITNHEKIFEDLKLERKFRIDTEIIPVLINYYLKKEYSLENIVEAVLNKVQGIASCAVTIPSIGKMLLFSNNGSLYFGREGKDLYFASEKFFLEQINCQEILVVKKMIIDIPKDNKKINETNDKNDRKDLVPSLNINKNQERLLLYNDNHLKRCKKCILPSTMPFIKFDEMGICNYCNNYKKKNIPKFKKSDLESYFEKILEQGNSKNCIVPLSGGRDSCVALHIAKKEFNLNPISYTYDWGLVTDLARRNISRMCSELNVENIIFADNISKKRMYIKKNVLAWLKNPHLGMVNLFTAGDKHFFRHIETVKKRTGIKIDLWGINPLEITHFKSGFLGIRPEFETKNVYLTGLMKQLNYHSKRTWQMIKNPAYFNRSIIDNLHGEFYRSFKKRSNHFSIFEFWKWNEIRVNKILELYDWEKSPDTKSTWRIGDGAAAFYNYIYYTLAGFSEHDTFRSNQIREGDLSRDEALKLVKEENKPRYSNIKWFTEIVDIEFENVIVEINKYKFNSH